MNSIKIPFLDIHYQHKVLETELINAFVSTIQTGAFIGGPTVELFERKFSEFCGSTHSIGVSNGTDALRFALIASGIKKNDIVITVPNTFIATVEAISQAGGVPEFVDVDLETANMSPEKLNAYLEENCFIDKITGETINTRAGKSVRAILPVHLYGRMAPMDALEQIAKKYNLVIIEDACQAHGAEYYSKSRSSWRSAGTIGCAAAFSFYPGKNLGALGDAGIVTTNDFKIASKIRMLRDHGQCAKYVHEIEGYNGRMDAIQASLLRIKINYLKEWNEKRRAVAAKYDALLKDVNEIHFLKDTTGYKSVYHLYIVRYKKRDELRQYLLENGIETGLHYPVPVHLQNAYRHLGFHSNSFPVSEIMSKEIISLPMYPHLQDDQISTVVDTIKTFMKK
jgi:dTDP-4-amino-4,6-dideoxygalactose transaminase